MKRIRYEWSALLQHSFSNVFQSSFMLDASLTFTRSVKKLWGRGNSKQRQCANNQYKTISSQKNFTELKFLYLSGSALQKIYASHASRSTSCMWNRKQAQGKCPRNGYISKRDSSSPLPSPNRAFRSKFCTAPYATFPRWCSYDGRIQARRLAHADVTVTRRWFCLTCLLAGGAEWQRGVTPQICCQGRLK